MRALIGRSGGGCPMAGGNRGGVTVAGRHVTFHGQNRTFRSVHVRRQLHCSNLVPSIPRAARWALPLVHHRTALEPECNLILYTTCTCPPRRRRNVRMMCHHARFTAHRHSHATPPSQHPSRHPAPPPAPARGGRLRLLPSNVHHHVTSCFL